jgi:hypothetical protein
MIKALLERTAAWLGWRKVYRVHRRWHDTTTVWCWALDQSDARETARLVSEVNGGEFSYDHEPVWRWVRP